MEISNLKKNNNKYIPNLKNMSEWHRMDTLQTLKQEANNIMKDLDSNMYNKDETKLYLEKLRNIYEEIKFLYNSSNDIVEKDIAFSTMKHLEEQLQKMDENLEYIFI